MKIIKGTSKGFFGNVQDVARHISQCLVTNEEWFINWSDTPYNDKQYGDNAWEYYFINPYRAAQGVTVGDYTNLSLFESYNFRQTMHFLLTNYIKLNHQTKQIINDNLFDLNISKRTLGVHIRKTDKHLLSTFGEPPSAKPLDTNIYLNFIDHLLPNYDQLFLATDDINEWSAVIAHVDAKHKKPVKYIDTFKSSGTISIHNNHSNVSGYKKGLDVLTDCYMLAYCGHIIRSTSNVGTTAQFLNLNLTHTNVNEILLGDTREQEYNLISQTI